MGKQTPVYMKDIFPPTSFSLFLIAELLSEQQTSFLVAPVAWQFLILHERMAGYK